ncbi:MAG TPA: hypothetical protein VHQ01_11405, partial [Pyrinomonadaceae bacterium]|nr:hypothetical protein [Pyrinomonadaceae bacterium]
MSKTTRRHFMLSVPPLATASLVLAADVLAGRKRSYFQTQQDWRFCDKCFNLFFDGYPDKGRCPAGGGHRAQGYNFALLYGSTTLTYPPPPPDPSVQGNWRYCDKCHVMFFDGFAGKGRCPAGGGHNAQGYNFKLTHDRAPGTNQQNNWRYCDRCSGMFFDGYPGKGVCPAGGGHRAQGYNFVLGHLPVPGDPSGLQEAKFSQQVLTPSGTALGGLVTLTFKSDGSYYVHFYMHD